jgi:hypothetical protein
MQRGRSIEQAEITGQEAARRGADHARTAVSFPRKLARSVRASAEIVFSDWGLIKDLRFA